MFFRFCKLLLALGNKCNVLATFPAGVYPNEIGAEMKGGSTNNI